jgi:hypothetical protein
MRDLTAAVPGLAPRLHSARAHTGRGGSPAAAGDSQALLVRALWRRQGREERGVGEQGGEEGAERREEAYKNCFYF